MTERGTTVQSLAFDRGEYTASSARAWARRHGYADTRVDETENEIRIRQHDPSRFAGFARKQIAPGISLVLGHRRGNPTIAVGLARPHRVPAVTAGLGRAIELVTETDGERTKHNLVDHGPGWHMLAPPDCMDRQAGHGRLYLVKGALVQTADLGDGHGVKARAAQAFQRWTRRAADRIGVLDTPDDGMGVPMGRAIRIAYASDKFGAKGIVHDYEHDFSEPFPLVYGTNASSPIALTIAGGRFRIGPRGIED